MPDYYDKEGNPIEELMDWARLASDDSYKIVKQDRIGRYFISTVWLGLNHNFYLDGPPLIFETMVFEDNSKYFDIDRYSTLEQAEAGHAAKVAYYSAG